MKRIMFNDFCGLTDAVLEGRKTMTRRIAYGGEIKDIHTGYMTEGVDAGKLALCDGNMIVAKSKYKVGEVVAVAQSFKDLGYTKEWVEQHISPNPNAKPTDPFEKKYPGWNNKMFVPAELNKAHQIRITDIKIEWLQDITDEDCLREGIQEFDTPVGKCYVAGGVYVGQDSRLRIAKGMINIAKPFKTPQEAFAVLIDKVSGKGSWESNPYVFVYSFELVK